jgi:hypothetical protein
MAEEEGTFPQLQLVVDQLVGIVAKEKGFHVYKQVTVSAKETNDVHIDVSRILINPFFLTLGLGGDPLAVVRHVFDVSLEFDAERQRRTLHAVNYLKHTLRSTIQKLREIDPTSLDEIIAQEYLESPDEVHLVVEEAA